MQNTCDYSIVVRNVFSLNQRPFLLFNYTDIVSYTCTYMWCNIDKPSIISSSNSKYHTNWYNVTLYPNTITFRAAHITSFLDQYRNQAYTCTYVLPIPYISSSYTIIKLINKHLHNIRYNSSSNTVTTKPIKLNVSCSNVANIIEPTQPSYSSSSNIFFANTELHKRSHMCDIRNLI